MTKTVICIVINIKCLWSLTKSKLKINVNINLDKLHISAAEQADCAILVVSAATDEFEAGFSKMGQTKVHALLAKTMGIEQIVCAVNKMDVTGPAYSQPRFFDSF